MAIWEDICQCNKCHNNICHNNKWEDRCKYKWGDKWEEDKCKYKWEVVVKWVAVINIGNRIHTTSPIKAGVKLALHQCPNGRTNMTAIFLLFSSKEVVVSVMDLEQ